LSSRCLTEKKCAREKGGRIALRPEGTMDKEMKFHVGGRAQRRLKESPRSVKQGGQKKRVNRRKRTGRTIILINFSMGEKVGLLNIGAIEK